MCSFARSRPDILRALRRSTRFSSLRRTLSSFSPPSIPYRSRVLTCDAPTHTVRRCLFSNQATTRSLPTSESAVKNLLLHGKLDKWGWVIYRTAYGNDEAWTRCKDIITYRVHDSITKSDAPEIVDNLELTFVEDQSLLEGASKDQLRTHFRAWANGAIKSENPRAKFEYPVEYCGIPRYVYFFQVDKESLKSIVCGSAQPPEPDLWFESHINFIDGYWEPLGERAAQQDAGGQNETEENEEFYEPIEGCTEENVGWVKISPTTMGTDWYEVWTGSFGGDASIWYPFYIRPPDMLYW